MDDRKPQVYDAVVTAVKPFGFFVDVIDLQVTGLVHIAGISKQYVVFNQASETLIAGKLSIKAGMSLKVYVARVDFPLRRLDFAYVQGSAVDTWNGGRHAEETRRAALAKQHGAHRNPKEPGARRAKASRPAKPTSGKPAKKPRKPRGQA